jgi:hypothetical protein
MLNNRLLSKNTLLNDINKCLDYKEEIVMLLDNDNNNNDNNNNDNNNNDNNNNDNNNNDNNNNDNNNNNSDQKNMRMRNQLSEIFDGHISDKSLQKINSYIYESDGKNYNFLKIISRINELKEINLGPLDNRYLYKDLIWESINGQEKKDFYGYVQSSDDLSNLIPNMESVCLETILDYQIIESKETKKYNPNMRNMLNDEDYKSYLSELQASINEYITIVDIKLTKRILSNNVN